MVLFAHPEGWFGPEPPVGAAAPDAEPRAWAAAPDATGYGHG